MRQHREGAPIVRIREGKNPRPVAVRRLAAKKRVPAEDSGAANGGPHAVQAVPIDDFYGRTDLDLHSRCYARQALSGPVVGSQTRSHRFSYCIQSQSGV